MASPLDYVLQPTTYGQFKALDFLGSEPMSVGASRVAGFQSKTPISGQSGAFQSGSELSTNGFNLNQDNWRFAGFRDMSKPYNKISYQGLLPNGMTPISSSPNAYSRSPSAYDEVSSSPLTLRTRTGFQSYLNRGFWE